MTSFISFDLNWRAIYVSENRSIDIIVFIEQFVNSSFKLVFIRQSKLKYSWKERIKIAKITTFGYEMLKNAEYIVVQVCRFSTFCTMRSKSNIFEPKVI